MILSSFCTSGNMGRHGEKINAHATDWNLQIIRKSLATGLLPVVQMAESLIHKKRPRVSQV